ncbi:MAG: ABC transporter permease [Bacteroidetes bacterium]|mgnify:CR=1 FL=1|jgi:lipopolysaccharide transport system permease protein|nr:ABC transporter permease [Bacteroidota bacterium]
MVLNLKEVWGYKDLLMMFVKRDFVTYYKQTILGPIWFFIQPIFTTLVYVFVFGNIAGLSTDGVPKVLFYLSGVTIWNYFADSFNKVSTTFKDNQQIFGKVYFPRIITPLSIVSSNLIKFTIQLLLFFGFLSYYLISGEDSISLNSVALLLPLLVGLMAGLGLGLGMMITSLTTKYRDLVFLLQFGIQLLMYATPVIYPLSTMPEKYKIFIQLNPMTGIIETFRYGFLGSGSFSSMLLLYSTLSTLILLLLGTYIFNKTEQNFIDTV